MKRLLKYQTKGQSLVFFVILTVVLFGILAFSVDMGYTYTMRRWAQNAADSAALAAARQICAYKDPNWDTWDPPITSAQITAFRKIEAVKAAIGYAGDDQFNFEGTDYYNTPLNKAFGVSSQDLTGITFGPDGGLIAGEVQTDVAIEHYTFAANFFGQTSIIEHAMATAACLVPGGAVGEGVIPVAWECRTINSDGNCDLDYRISDNDTCELGDDYMYVFFDINSADEIYWCDGWGAYPVLPPGSTATYVDVNCDVNNDGTLDIEPINPLFPDHKWFWINIGGGGCTGAELVDIIENGLSIPMYEHQWFPQCEGVIATTYNNMATVREGDDVIIPVFYPDCTATSPLVSPYNLPENCDPCPQDTLCTKYDGTSCTAENAGTQWFHLTDFEMFHMHCVEAPNTSCDDITTDAREWLEVNNVDEKGKTIFGNESSFEGCFISGYDSGFVGSPGSGDPDGTWTISLTR